MNLALFLLSGIGSIVWLIILLLPWSPWNTQERLDSKDEGIDDLSDITVLIPARDEAEVIEKTLRGVLLQGQNHKIILVDDQSSDGTSEIAKKTVQNNLEVIRGE